jgi:hypothetical protein
MNKFHNTVHDLANAIYQTRPMKGPAFDPQFALKELAHVGAKFGVEAMMIQAQWNGFKVSGDTQRVEQLLAGAGSAAAEELFNLYFIAMLHHEPFTDVLGLANELLKKMHNVSLPDFFVPMSVRVYCQTFAEDSLSNGTPFLSDDYDRSGSGVLASLSGLIRKPELLKQRKVRIKMICQSDLATKMMLMQLFNPLCNMLGYLEWVKIGETTSGKELMSVQRQHHCQEAA